MPIVDESKNDIFYVYKAPREEFEKLVTSGESSKKLILVYNSVEKDNEKGKAVDPMLRTFHDLPLLLFWD